MRTEFKVVENAAAPGDGRGRGKLMNSSSEYIMNHYPETVKPPPTQQPPKGQSAAAQLDKLLRLGEEMHLAGKRRGEIYDELCIRNQGPATVPFWTLLESVKRHLDELGAAPAVLPRQRLPWLLYPPYRHEPELLTTAEQATVVATLESRPRFAGLVAKALFTHEEAKGATLMRLAPDFGRAVGRLINDKLGGPPPEKGGDQ